MKKGIIRVPEWVKNIPDEVEFQSSMVAKCGYRYLISHWHKNLDGKIAEFSNNSWVYNPASINSHPLPAEWIEPIEEENEPNAKVRLNIPETVNLEHASQAQSLKDFNGQTREVRTHPMLGLEVMGHERWVANVPREWIELEEEPINWNRVKVDAPIEVFYDGDIQLRSWVPAHFSNHINDMTEGCAVGVFADGKTSHTTSLIHKYKKFRFPKGVNPEDYYEDE
jgi:hypothetical protein